MFLITKAFILPIKATWSKLIHNVALKAAMLLGAGIDTLPGIAGLLNPSALLPELFPASSAVVVIFLKNAEQSLVMARLRSL